MENTKKHRILVFILVTLIIAVISLSFGIIFLVKLNSSPKTFEDKMSEIDSKLNSIFILKENLINREEFISELTEELQNTNDKTQRLRLGIAAAYYYYYDEDYEKGIEILEPIDSSECSLEYQYYKMTVMIKLYEANGDIESARGQIILIMELPDEDFANQSMSSVKRTYSAKLEELENE